MRPVQTERANQVFNPPAGTSDWCDPVWVERTTFRAGGQDVPCLKLTYRVEPEDLARLTAGGHLELTIVGGGMPPVSLGVVAPLAPSADVPGPLPVG